MKKIIPVSQNEFDLTVDFHLDDGEVRTETIALKPYYSDEVRSFPAVDKDGKPLKDKKGNEIMDQKTVQIWTNPADDLKGFLQRYGAALEQGKEVEKAPKIAADFFGTSL